MKPKSWIGFAILVVKLAMVKKIEEGRSDS